ncbi:MAG: polysaccharide biosynthesis protein [Candidatus Sericytochromatia bacterium]
MLKSLTPYFTPLRLFQLALDLTISIAAFWAAYTLRFEGQIPAFYLEQFWRLLPFAIALRFLWRFPGGLHEQLWRYVSLRETLHITAAITAGSLALLFVSLFASPLRIPMGVLALDWCLNLIGYIGLRAFKRVYSERQPKSEPTGKERRVLLVGAGQAGNIFAKEIQQRQGDMRVVGFVDDDPYKQHSRIQGVPVLGVTARIPSIVAIQQIDEVIFCIPSASRADMRRIIDLCHEAKVPVKTLPSLKDIISGSVELGNIREVQIEDLLGRDPVAFDRETTSSYISGRVVMVTGAGGSIGSELCRQLATLAPSRLLLVGRGEYSIYTIEMELREKFPTLELVPLIADVRDLNRMTRLYERYAPEVIFHAAAHKHVPLMEKNPSEAILNNVFGTRNVAMLADRFNAETFVLVSTDKAVNPTNVMGASKRTAELVVQELGARSKTRFMSVRFGNVLGSSGSVIPLFKRQIAQGGPITITHPEIIRYFMTIPEAAQLVLQAGALGQGGEVFVLDMGDPVKIVDLARDLIKLSGLEPEIDVKIKFTGLRPGEKLYEELLTAEEGTAATTHKKIFIARPEAVDREKLELGLTLLQTAATEGDELAIRRGLKNLVTTYREPQVQA